MRNNHDILPVTILCIFALVNAKASPAFGNARLAIERTTCDLGEVFDETPAKALFTVRNVGSSTLRLTPKKVSCGCVGVKSSEIVIPASSEATIPVTINVRGRRGRQNHSGFVHNQRFGTPRIGSFRSRLSSTVGSFYIAWCIFRAYTRTAETPPCAHYSRDGAERLFQSAAEVRSMRW